MISELALEFALLGANVLFLGGNIYAAERYWRRRRRDRAEADRAATSIFTRELAEALHTALRFRAGVVMAAARLEALLETEWATVKGTRVYVEVRATAIELVQLVTKRE